VDEDALVDALRGGGIAGAALDVFREEPLPGDHPLLGLENVVLSPHVAGSTRDAVRNGARIIADQVAAILDGEEPGHRIA
jgi:D-3-phosphoglycerate dehydrogenase